MSPFSKDETVLIFVHCSSGTCPPEHIPPLLGEHPRIVNIFLGPATVHYREVSLYLMFNYLHFCICMKFHGWGFLYIKLQHNMVYLGIVHAMQLLSMHCPHIDTFHNLVYCKYIYSTSIYGYIKKNCHKNVMILET